MTILAAILVLAASAQDVQVRPAERATAPKAPLRVEVMTPCQRAIVRVDRLLARARAQRAAFKPNPGQPTPAELDAAIADLQAQRDELSNMSDEQSLRMQMIMDRMSKAEQTLSNLLKKISETQNSIIENIK